MDGNLIRNLIIGIAAGVFWGSAVAHQMFDEKSRTAVISVYHPEMVLL